ncbi:MAG: dolichyl-phosphate beta-D-mannosyltransferase [Candidatus Fluviicola riflensis]|nr:MAG: dolichyl-phosphate beta-D-mannosyltransferase [Candidatus Fluviicola riflensis]
MIRTVVIIPTYNERENVQRMAETVMALDGAFHILFVDDNSPDGTADLIREKQAEYPDRIFLEERTGKLGLGTAYIHGFKWALKQQYDYIFEMDCDFSHNPADLPRLLSACTEQGAQLSIGSRYCRGGKVKNWPVGRVMLSYFASVYVRMILFLGISDTTAGFMCYSSKVLEAIDLDQIHFKGYAFQIEMKYAAKRKGFKIIEVPITFIDRQYGESKMSSSIFKEALFGVWKMRKLKV